MRELWLYIAIFTVFYFITKHFLDKLRNLPPSPFPNLPLLGHFHFFTAPTPRNLAKLAARHGPILLLRLGRRRALLVSSPSAAEECLTENDIIFANRPPLFAGEILGYSFTTLEWAPYGDLWRNLRRITSAEILSSNRLHHFAGIRYDEVKALVRRLNFGSQSDDGYRKVNMQSAIFDLVNNVMLRMVVGKRYFGEKEETDEARRLRDVLMEIKNLGEIVTIGDFFPVLRCLAAGQEKKFRKVFRKIDGFFQELVDQQRRTSESENESGDYSLIKVLISLQKTDPQSYTDEIIKGLVLVLLLAGTETSGATIEWALSLLLNNPIALKKAQLEIDENVGCNRLIKESDLKQLVYLRCIINETLRMYPVLPLLAHNSSEACTVSGYQVPKDTMLLVNLWAIQNDPKQWDEPWKFKPERFDGVEGNKVGHKFMPFGAGRRSCPGEALAVRNVGLVLGSLLQCFEWDRVAEELVDMEEMVGMTLPKAKPLIAKCRPRQLMTEFSVA